MEVQPHALIGDFTQRQGRGQGHRIGANEPVKIIGKTSALVCFFDDAGAFTARGDDALVPNSAA